MERRYQETGAPEDGERYWRAVLRRGDEAAVQTAAQEGDACALVALGVHPLVLRLDQWLHTTRPELRIGFHPGASEAELRATEEALGRALPEPLRSMYRWRNGQIRDVHADPTLRSSPPAVEQQDDQETAHAAQWLFGDWRLVDLATMLSLHQRLVSQQWDPDSEEARPWTADCLPFMFSGHLPGDGDDWEEPEEDGGGNEDDGDEDGEELLYYLQLRCVDPQGIYGGSPSQVLDGDLMTGVNRIVAPSFERWLLTQIAILEQGLRSSGDDPRPSYFSSAVNPGYPQRFTDDGGLEPAPRYYQDSELDPWSLWLGCTGCSCFMVGIGLLVALVVVAIKSGPPGLPAAWTVTWQGALVTMALTTVLALGSWIYNKIQDRRLTAEFANAKLEE